MWKFRVIFLRFCRKAYKQSYHKQGMTKSLQLFEWKILECNIFYILIFRNFQHIKISWKLYSYMLNIKIRSDIIIWWWYNFRCLTVLRTFAVNFHVSYRFWSQRHRKCNVFEDNVPETCRFHDWCLILLRATHYLYEHSVPRSNFLEY